MFDSTPWDRRTLPRKKNDTRPIAIGGDMGQFVDRFFESMKNEIGFPGNWVNPQQLNPAVDIIEEDTGYKLEVELPGMKPEDVDITVHDGCISIKGSKETTKDEEEDNYICRERYSGHYQRTFSLPQNINEDEIRANFHYGVLVLDIPKTEEAQKSYRKIELD